MDQLICDSLSHTHYWYEVGMLKVPWYVCVHVCVVLPFIMDVWQVDVPHTQEEGQTGFLHLPSAVLDDLKLSLKL